MNDVRSAVVVVAVAVVVVGAVAFAVACGPDGLSFPGELFDLRVSRVALGFIVGAALSTTGAALQALLRNPLADPFVLGVSGGAAMGAALFSAVAGAALATSTLTSALPSLALAVGLSGSGIIGALLASGLLVLFVTHDRGEGTVLVGIVLNSFSWAVVAVVRALVPASSLGSLSNWLIGSIGYPDTASLVVAGVITAAGIAALVSQAGLLFLLRGGDDEAVRLGVPLARVRLIVVAACSALVGVAVGTTGVIGFVGLLIPHAVRRVLGSDDRVVLPASALLGGALLCAFDGVARVGFVVVGSEVPVGAACALIGAPLFAVLLWGSRDRT